MKSRKIRWMVVCLAGAVVFVVGAARMFQQAQITVGVIYCLLAVVFILLAFAYFKGYLK